MRIGQHLGDPRFRKIARARDMLRLKIVDLAEDEIDIHSRLPSPRIGPRCFGSDGGVRGSSAGAILRPQMSQSAVSPRPRMRVVWMPCS
jgi:hypothetical protein